MSYSLLLHLNGANGDSSTTDSSPSAHPISLLSGAALSSAQTKFGATSLLLDGVNDYLQANNNYQDWSFAAGQAFTVDLWIYLPALPGADKSIIAIEQGIYTRWAIKIKSTGSAAFEVYNGSPVPAVNISGGSISAGAWTHIAAVRQTSGAINLHVNGSSVGSASYSSALAGGAPLKAGLSIYPSPVYLNAYLDEIRVLINEPAWTADFTPPTAPYSPLFDVHAEHGSLIIAITEAEHGSSIITWITQEHGSPIACIIEQEHGSPCGAWVETEHGSPITWLVEAEHCSRHSLLVLIEAEHGSLYNLLGFTQAEAEHCSLYAAYVEAEHGSPISLLALVEQEHGSRFSSLVLVEAEHGSLFHLLPLNPVEAEHASPFRLGLAESINVTDSAILYHKGRRVEILSARVKQDDGDPFWSGSAELADAGDYSLMVVDDPVSLILGSETYSLVIDSKEKSRSFGQVSLSVTLLSPGAELSFPRTKPVTKTWPAVMARTAAEEVIGASINWQIADWIIPENRLAVTGAAPLEIARKIVESAGGILQSKPDGSFTARPRFPVSIPNWPSAVPDFILTDDLHNLSTQEMHRRPEIVNQVTIRDTSGDSSQDMTEYEADKTDPLKGLLYVWPRPWRPIAVAHTGHPAVGLTPLGIQLLAKKQLVEFKAGRAQVSHPVASILQVKWQYADLGAVSFSGSDLTVGAIHESPLQNTGYSLAWITFNTRCYAFAVKDTIPETIQFLVMDRS